MDIIFIREFRCDAWVGVYDWEQLRAQPLEIDIEIAMQSEAAGTSDKLKDTIDYGRVVEVVRATLAREKFKLLEALAERVCAILIRDLGAPQVKFSVAKINHMAGVKRMGVCITRTAAAVH